MPSLFDNSHPVWADANATSNRRKNLLGLTDQLYNYTQQGSSVPSKSLFGTETYNTGIGALRSLLSDQGDKDRAAAAARGVSGGEAGSAAAANRLKALVQGQRGLVQQSGHEVRENTRRRDAEGERKRALMLQLLGIQTGQDRFDQQRLDNRRGQSLAFLGDLGRVMGSLFGKRNRNQITY